MSLTPDLETLRRLRADIGDPEAKVYTDPVLAALMAEPQVGGDYDRAVEVGLWRLVSNGALFDRYASGMKPDEREAASKMLRETYKLWRDSHRPAGGTPRVGQGRIAYTGAGGGSEF